MKNSERLKKEILDKVAKYYQLVHKKREFIPGDSKIHYAGRVFNEKEMTLMASALLDFWLTLGPYGEKFEQQLSEFLQVKEVILVNSGSSANLAAIAALMSKQFDSRLQKGDEVITPAVTFPTTVAPMIQNGLIPVFVDCELGSYNLKVELLEEAISSRTRALFFPHTLGNPCQMDKILEIAAKYDLLIIEDTCDALGSKYNGKYAGTFGHLATLSFYPAHHITLGEGGAVVTQDKKLARIVRSVRDWGRDCYCKYNEKNPFGACNNRFNFKIKGFPHYDHRYVYSNIGYNLKPLDLQPAMGLAQLEKLPDFIRKRNYNFTRLFEGLKKYQDELILPIWPPNSEPSWFAFPITVRQKARFSRKDLVSFLELAKIETRFLFAGNILNQPAYEDIACRIVGELPNSELIMKNSFFIGIYPGLDDVHLDYILEKFQQFFEAG